MGGSERQLYLIEQELVNNGCDVSHIHAQPGANKYPEFRVCERVKTYHVGSNNLVEKRLYYLRLIRFLNEMKDKIDLLYTREYHDLFILSKFSKEYGIPIIRAISSDSICSTLFQSGFKIGKRYNDPKTIFKKFLSDFAMSDTDMIVTQTKYQKKLIKKNFGLDSVVIPNGCVVTDKKPEKYRNGFFVSWLGNMRSQKRPELFVELAQRTNSKEIKFVFAGKLPSDKKLRKHIIQSVKSLDNLYYAGHLSYENAISLAGRSSILVNTSTHEGFPNTFLESWSQYTPVFTLGVDTDNIISRKGVGKVCTDIEDLSRSIISYSMNKSKLAKTGKKARSLVEDKYDIKKTTGSLIEVFQKSC